MLASLPMYDFPEVRDATDAFWGAVATRLGVSVDLTRGEDWTAPWHNPDLLFSQTCGYPFTHEFAETLRYVATPHYAADGCEGPNYRSILFARKNAPLSSFEGKIAAFNNRDSMSGMLALQLVFAPLADEGIFFSSAIETGGHIASLQAVQQARADICAIDCVTVAYARHYRANILDGLVEVGRSPQVPGLPFVTRCGDVRELRATLLAVLNDPRTDHHRDKLLLRDCSILPEHSYRIITELEYKMQTSGGLQLW